MFADEIFLFFLLSSPSSSIVFFPSHALTAFGLITSHEFVIANKFCRTSHDISPHKNKIELLASVVRTAELEIKGSTEPEQVFYGGEVKGESSMVWEDDVGSLVTNTFVVTNRGPWQVRRLEVQIEWPLETKSSREHGKWLLYLMETQVQGIGYCEPGGSLNPLNLRVRVILLSAHDSNFGYTQQLRLKLHASRVTFDTRFLLNSTIAQLLFLFLYFSLSPFLSPSFLLLFLF